MSAIMAKEIPEEIIRKSRYNIVIVLAIQIVLTYGDTPQTNVPRYSTKTGYDLAFDSNDILRRELPWEELFQGTSHNLQNCKPAGLYVVYRHGSRYPKSKDMIKYNAFLNRVKNSSINPKYEFLQNGKQLPKNRGRALSESGKLELKHLAVRLKKRFPELFPEAFNLSDFAFQSSNLSRTIDSTLSFIQGLININKSLSTFSSSQKENELIVSCQALSSKSKEQIVVPLYNKTSDYLLRFFEAYEDCLEDQTDGDEKEEHDDDNKREDEKFVAESEEVGALQQRLIERLAVPGSKEKFNLSRDEAIDIPKMCGYELALFNQSNWCGLLSDEDIRVFEYKQDLKHYWKRGYGHPVNYLVACNLARDIVSYFNQVTNKRKKTPKGVFKFAHAETLIPLESLLDLYRDEKPLTMSTYQEHKNRKFRTSWMAPFAGNVAFVLFNCSDKEDDGVPVYKLEVLMNELPVDLPFCQSDSGCELKDFAEHIGKVIGKCNFNSTCCIENCGSTDCVPFQFNTWTTFCITVTAVAMCVWIIIMMIEFGLRRGGANYVILKKNF